MDNFLEIGATVILEGLSTGMDKASTIVEESTSAMTGAFKSMAASVGSASAGVIDSFHEIGVGSAEMATRVVESAETAKLSVEGMTSAFSGLGALLGAGIVAGFVLHAADETQKLVLELGHLSQQTGIAIETLAGLHAVAEETGVAFQAFETAMVRLLRAQELAVEGGKMQILAFERLKISIEGIKSLAPEDLFYRVATAISHSASASDTAASAIALFGRGGAALIPILKQYGDTLKVVVDEHGKLSLITNDTYNTTVKYQKVSADMTEAWRGIMIPTMTMLTWAMEGVNAAFQTAAAVVATFLEGVTNAFHNTIALAETTWSALKAGATGGLGAMETAWHDGMVKVTTINTDSAKTVDNIWQDTYKHLTSIFATPLNIPLPDQGPTGEGKDPKAKKEKDTSAAEITALHKKQFEEDFNAAKKFSEEEIQLKKQEMEEENKFGNIEIDEFSKHELAKIELTKKSLDEELKDKKISAAEAEKLLTDLEDKEYKIRKDAIVARIKLEEETTDNPVVLAKLNAELEALADKHEAKLTEIHLKGVAARVKEDEKAAKQEDQFADRMGRNMTRFFDSTIMHARSFHDAMRNIFLDLEQIFLNSLVRMLGRYIAHKVAKLVIAETTQQSEVAITAAGTAEAEGIELKAALRSILRAAAKGAAHAFEKVMEAVPFPINAVLAPVAAAGTFAAIMAFGGSVASAEGGWDVPRDSLAMIHKDEMVLPAPLAEGVRKMANQSDTIANLDRDIHVHFNANIQALDAQGFERVLQRHSQAMARQMVRVFRNGNVKLDYALR